MNENFNRQFVLIDFKLLDDARFLQFCGSSEFSTYLVLKRHIWRGSEPHFMGLHKYYLQDKKLVCSIDQTKISNLTGIVRQNTSTILTSLEEKGIIKRIRTGRQSIYVLGEWIDVKGDGSYKLEWFYLDGEFGISKADVAKRRQQMSDKKPSLMSQKDDNLNISNKELNREENTVNGSIVKKLINLDQPMEKTEYIVDEILDELGDKHSSNYYKIIARKIPEMVIRQALKEINADGAENPKKVFTFRMEQYARDRLRT